MIIANLVIKVLNIVLKKNNNKKKRNNSKKEKNIFKKEKNKTETNNNQKEKNNRKKQQNKIQKSKNITEDNKYEENEGEKKENKNKQAIQIVLCDDDDSNSKNNNNFANMSNDNNKFIIKSFPLKYKEDDLPKSKNSFINKKRRDENKIEETELLSTKNNKYNLNKIDYSKEKIEEGLFNEPFKSFGNENKDDEIGSSDDLNYSQNNEKDNNQSPKKEEFNKEKLRSKLNDLKNFKGQRNNK